MEVENSGIRKTVEKVDRKLDSLYIKWMAHFKPIKDNAGIDDFIYTEQQEAEWLNTEPTFTKRIVTEIPTKRRRRVTRLRVTVPLRRIHSPVTFRRMLSIYFDFRHRDAGK